MKLLDEVILSSVYSCAKVYYITLSGIPFNVWCTLKLHNNSRRKRANWTKHILQACFSHSLKTCNNARAWTLRTELHVWNVRYIVTTFKVTDETQTIQTMRRLMANNTILCCHGMYRYVMRTSFILSHTSCTIETIIFRTCFHRNALSPFACYCLLVRWFCIAVYVRWVAVLKWFCKVCSRLSKWPNYEMECSCEKC